MSVLLELNTIECRYQAEVVVKDLSMSIYTGELVCLLGSSGCGKTTILRAIAGFEPLFQGTIKLNGQTISAAGMSLPPEQRNIGMVFQDYALFPHCSVLDNVCFGLRKLSRTERLKRAKRFLELVGLPHLGNRYPHELSGGQQQRVALARALAPHPAIILMDEPFSNLDVDLREQLSLEVREILKSEGITGLLVTHDQHEAFALGDKIGVMQAGKILQWDTPYQIYHEPTHRFVADFIGQSTFVGGTLLAPERIQTELGILTGNRCYDWESGTTVEVLVRPDDILLDSDSATQATVVNKSFKGAETLYTLALPSGSHVLSLIASHHDYPVGSQLGIRIGERHHLIAFQHSTPV